MHLLLVLLTLTLLCSMGEPIFYRGSESHTSDVSLERFYLLEENVMSNADALLREDYFGPEEEESREEHTRHALNLTEMESVLRETKDLHREAGIDLENFLGHPINVLNLFRRLNDQWKKGLDLLLRSTPCKLWKIRTMRRYLTFLRDNVPDLEDLKKLVRHMTRLQKTQGTPTRELTNGRLGNIQAGQPLGVEDQYQIGMILYDDDDFPAAVSWLQLVDEWMKSASDLDLKAATFKQKVVLSKMATGYYGAGRIDEAVDVANRLVDMEPSNPRYLENLNFLLLKQTLRQVDGRFADRRGQTLTETWPRSRMERICAGKEFQLSRKRCVLEPVHGPRPCWYFNKKEVLRQKPQVALYHDVIDDFTMGQLREYTHSKLTNKAWVSSSVFVTPPMGSEINYPDLPRKKSLRYSVQRLSRAFTSVPGPDMELLLGWGRLHVLNTGRSGIHFNRYQKELHLKPARMERGLGAMFAFLSEPIRGGEIVMAKWKIVSPAPKGSILVYYASQSRLHSLCPVIGGSQWVAVQPFYERGPDMCIKKHL